MALALTEVAPDDWHDGHGNTFWGSRWPGFTIEQLRAAADEYEAKPELDLAWLAAELRDEIAGRERHGGRVIYPYGRK